MNLKNRQGNSQLLVAVSDGEIKFFRNAGARGDRRLVLTAAAGNHDSDPTGRRAAGRNFSARAGREFRVRPFVTWLSRDALGQAMVVHF